MSAKSVTFLLGFLRITLKEFKWIDFRKDRHASRFPRSPVNEAWCKIILSLFQVMICLFGAGKGGASEREREPIVAKIHTILQVVLCLILLFVSTLTGMFRST
jgi:hypothetical protein